MSQSILISTKKNLGLDADYHEFDLDVITHINATFLTLQQLGVGPIEGFMIEGEDETWEALLGGDPRLNAVKQYVYLKVRIAFDPPSTSFAIESMKHQIQELEWRLNVAVDTAPSLVDVIELSLDGGTP